MPKWFTKFKKNAGSRPITLTEVVLSPNPNTQYYYQEKQSYPWFVTPAHEQRSALVNCWSGNQLPGDTNFIPGVPLSNFTWNIPTSYMNSLVNQQYNQAYNIQNSTPQQQSNLLKQAIQNWQNRSAY